MCVWVGVGGEGGQGMDAARGRARESARGASSPSPPRLQCYPAIPPPTRDEGWWLRLQLSSTASRPPTPEPMSTPKRFLSTLSRSIPESAIEFFAAAMA